MKAKRILAVLLGVAMVCSLTACGGSTQGNSTDVESAGEEMEDVEELSVEEEFEEEEREESAREITFEETTLIDNEYITFTVKSVGPDEEYSWYYDVEVEITNKSADAEYNIDIDSVYVNGVEIYTHIEYGAQAKATLVAGQTTTLNLQLEDDSNLLKNNGIIEYTDVMIPVEVKDENNDTIMKEMVHIYPYGEENATAYVREPLDTDQVVIDNEYVTVTVVDAFAQSGLIFYVQNKTDSKICVWDRDDLLVNGCEGLLYIALEGGQSAFDDVSFWDDEGWEQYFMSGEVEAGTLEFTIAGHYDENYTGDELFEQLVTVTVE